MSPASKARRERTHELVKSAVELPPVCDCCGESMIGDGHACATAAKPAPKPVARTSGFACMECGHKFRTLKAAERASLGADGCPKCGGSDIDLSTDAVRGAA